MHQWFCVLPAGKQLFVMYLKSILWLVTNRLVQKAIVQNAMKVEQIDYIDIGN